MNFIQSPPRFGNKSPKNGHYQAQNGKFQWLRRNFFKGGLKTKDMNTLKEMLTNSNPFILFFIWLESDNNTKTSSQWQE